MSFGVPPHDDRDPAQHKFFHSVDKQFLMDHLQWPAAFDPSTVPPPGRPQSVPVCFEQFEHRGYAGNQLTGANFKVNKFQLDSDRQSDPPEQYLQNQERLPHLTVATGGYPDMNQLFSDMN
jgi:hypothetical protein